MHTGGSISLQDHAICLLEELGQFVYVDEVFQQTHLRKDIGQFVNDRSRRTHHTQGSSSSAEDAAEMNRLREELHLSKEEMCVFQSVVLQFLPREAGTLFINNNNLTNSRTMQITNRGTLFMTILTTDLASQNYY
ncbi:hypothetical protein JHK87_006702 [Glycine soja]|nr:hypothetical protein JHK87_006702 [Glycine soja]